MALCFGRSVPAAYVTLSAIVVVSGIFKGTRFILLVPFLGGMAAAHLVQFSVLRRFAASAVATIMFVVLLGITAICYESAEEFVPLILLFVAFTTIACGNTYFVESQTDARIAD